MFGLHERPLALIEDDCAGNPRIGIMRALNESTGRLFRAATQHRQNNSDDQSKKESKENTILKFCYTGPDWCTLNDMMALSLSHYHYLTNWSNIKSEMRVIMCTASVYVLNLCNVPVRCTCAMYLCDAFQTHKKFNNRM